MEHDNKTINLAEPLTRLSGTEKIISHLDNNYHAFSQSDEVAIVVKAVDEEATGSLTRKGAIEIPDFLTGFDPDKEVTVSLPVLLASSTSQWLMIELAPEGKTYRLTSSTGISTTLPRSLLKKNKGFGKRADLMRAVIDFVLLCIDVPFEDKSKEKVFGRYVKHVKRLL